MDGCGNVYARLRNGKYEEKEKKKEVKDVRESQTEKEKVGMGCMLWCRETMTGCM